MIKFTAWSVMYLLLVLLEKLLTIKALKNYSVKLLPVVQITNYSVVRKSFVKGSNSKMINATIGRPDFDVPVKIKEEAKLHIDLGHNAYTETKGIAPLRQAISKHLQKRNVNRSPDEII